MKRSKQSPTGTSSERSRQDIERIHHMLSVAIEHIEKKTRSLLTTGTEPQSDEALDDILTGLTKITALISKLVPIEMEMANQPAGSQQVGTPEDVDWEMLERYFRKNTPE